MRGELWRLWGRMIPRVPRERLDRGLMYFTGPQQAKGRVGAIDDDNEQDQAGFQVRA